MKITLNTCTGCLVIKAMELTGNSISGVIREALFLYIQHVSTKTRVVDMSRPTLTNLEKHLK